MTKTKTAEAPPAAAPHPDDVLRERIQATIHKLGTNDAKAEFYCDIRAHMALKKKEFEDALLFETNMLRAIEADFKAQLNAKKQSRLPVNDFEVTLERKTEKQYDAEALETELAKIITKKELEAVVQHVEVIKTNGTEINKLVRAYGKGSDVDTIVSRHMTEVETGTAKLKIEARA